MNDYWKMMTGAKAKHKKKPEENRELTQVDPIQVTPEVMGSVHDLAPRRELPRSLDEMSALDASQSVLDPDSMRRLSDAARTGETTIEMRECVARTDGRIKARSVEVSISYGERLSLGELLRGCLSMMDHTRHGFGRAVALPRPSAYMDAEALRAARSSIELARIPTRSIEPLDSPFRVLDAPPRKGLGYKKA